MLQPLNDYVIIEAVKAEAKTDSGIILAEGLQETQDEGVIVKVGSSVPPRISEGLKVRYLPHRFSEILDGGKAYKIGKAENIIAVENAD